MVVLRTDIDDNGHGRLHQNDGRLNYGREAIEEAYYTLHLWRGAYPSFGIQHINNLGYYRTGIKSRQAGAHEFNRASSY